MGDKWLQEEVNNLNENGQNLVDKTEHWSRKGWENMSDKQIKSYNIFYKTILKVAAIMLLLLAIVFPPCLVLSIAVFYYALKFDANKAKRNYGGYKYFLVFGGGLCCLGMGLVFPPLLLVGSGLLYISYRFKKSNLKNETDTNLNE